jgi:hypothetical protein
MVSVLVYPLVGLRQMRRAAEAAEKLGAPEATPETDT